MYKRQSQAALPAWEALSSRFPAHAMAHFALGNARHTAADLEGAISAFRDAVAADATLAPAWLNLGLALSSAERRDEAMEALERAAALPGRWQERSREALERVRDK